jgi:hypothetical protein
MAAESDDADTWTRRLRERGFVLPSATRSQAPSPPPHRNPLLSRHDAPQVSRDRGRPSRLLLASAKALARAFQVRYPTEDTASLVMLLSQLRALAFDVDVVSCCFPSAHVSAVPCCNVVVSVALLLLCFRAVSRLIVCHTLA